MRHETGPVLPFKSEEVKSKKFNKVVIKLKQGDLRGKKLISRPIMSPEGTNDQEDDSENDHATIQKESTTVAKTDYVHKKDAREIDILSHRGTASTKNKGKRGVFQFIFDSFVLLPLLCWVYVPQTHYLIYPQATFISGMYSDPSHLHCSIFFNRSY